MELVQGSTALGRVPCECHRAVPCVPRLWAVVTAVLCPKEQSLSEPALLSELFPSSSCSLLFQHASLLPRSKSDCGDC